MNKRLCYFSLLNKEDEVEKIIWFVKSMVATLLVYAFLLLLLKIIHLKPASIYTFIACIICFFCVAQLYIEYFAANISEYITTKEEMEKEKLTLKEIRRGTKLTGTLGWIERIIYAISFILGQYGVIGFWFGIKIASRLIGYTEVVGLKAKMEEGKRRDAFLIGNIISLILGILVGIIAKDYIKSNYPIFLNNIRSYLGLLNTHS